MTLTIRMCGRQILGDPLVKSRPPIEELKLRWRLRRMKMGGFKGELEQSHYMCDGQ